MTLIDGQEADTVPANDRGLAYGDGLFETLRFQARRAVFLAPHLERMQTGCERLRIQFDCSDFKPDIRKLLQHSTLEDGVLKLMLTRGSGGRGYRASGAHRPRRIASLHELPPAGLTDSGKVFLCQQRLGSQPALAGIKHLNRLEQVLASSEWPDDSFAEGLMLDCENHVIEGTRSNVFLLHRDRLLTPDLEHCGVAGIFRQHLLQAFGSAVAILPIGLETLLHAEEVFFCNSVSGVWPVSELHTADGIYTYEPGSLTAQATALFKTALQTC